MSDRVIVFGSFNVDLMARAAHLPVPGETVSGSLFRQGPGGKGFNQAVAAHKAGADVTTVIKLGNDPLANVALDVMEQLQMPRNAVFFHPEVSTGTALITVDDVTGQNAIVVVPGANGTFTRADIEGLSDVIAGASYLLLQMEVNQDANEYIARLAKDRGVRVIINTAPWRPVSDAFLQGAYLVTPNEVEAEEMTGIAITDLSSADRAAAVLQAGGVENVIITLGSRGVYLNDRVSSQIIPANRVRAVDTTGAGDGFNGGLLAALAEGKTLREACVFANALAALSVQRPGATASMPTRAEIDAFLAKKPV